MVVVELIDAPDEPAALQDPIHVREDHQELRLQQGGH